MPFSRTNERRFADMRVALQEQSAEGTPATDFSSGTGAMIWSRAALFNENAQFQTFQGTHGSIQERSEGQLHTHNLPAAEVRFYPTPLIIKEILRSFAGPFSGTAVTWPNGISTYFSFLLAEEADGTAGFRAWRYEDSWVRELEFNIGGFGVVECTARLIAQNVTRFNTDDAGLTYPANPPDFVQFAHRNASFLRDPAGLNVDLATKQITLRLTHGFTHEPFNSAFGTVTKQGMLEVRGTFTGRYMDETVALRADAEAETLRAFRIRLVAGSDELRFDLNNVHWQPADKGFDARDVRDFTAEFRAASTDPDTENAVDINIL